MMDSVAKLTAIEEIRHLKARYFRFVDTQDWPQFRALLTDDAVFYPSLAAETRQEGNKIEGGDSIVAWISTAMKGATSVHRGFMPEIEVVGPNDASGIWAMEDFVRWPGRAIHGMGHYNEVYVRTMSGWTIKSFRITRQWVDIETYSPR